MASGVTTTPTLPPDAVTARYRALIGRRVTPVAIGLINKTFVVDGRAGKVVLQELHPVFSATVNEDIDVVTAHLATKGVPTPRPVRTDDGALFVDVDGKVWRALTFVDGRTHERLSGSALAQEAGALVGRFHAAMQDLDHTYRFQRAGVHDTDAHIQKLTAALDAHRSHRLYDIVAGEAGPLLLRLRDRRDFSTLPLRHAHGDLKVSNLLFDAHGRGLCLVDLDTLSRMNLAFEMGDALRSWTNPRHEDETGAAVDEELFRAAMNGYAESARAFITDDEKSALVDGVMTIALELSARFLADALSESYFGFDAARYPARGEHNLARGRAMRDLGEDVVDKKAKLETLVDEAFR